MSPKILIVDDEPTIADTLSEIFRRAGYETFTAYNGVLGLKAARKLAPNLVLSDVMMPELDGVSMAIEICSQMPDIRIMLFSGQAATADLLKTAERRGFHFDLLQKPVAPAEIIRKVDLALNSQGGSCRATTR